MSVTFFPQRRLPNAWRRMARPTWSFAAPAAVVDTVPTPGTDWLEHHGSGVAWVSEQIALAMGLPPATAATIAAAARMHDIGKRLLPGDTIDKPGQLTPADWGWIRRHPELGASAVIATSALSGSELQTAIAVTLLHHERWDGRGYPCGLREEAIPLCARIVAVADVFDALVSERPYKRAWDEADAFSYVLACAGTQFDPACVSAFAWVYASFPGGWPQRGVARTANAPKPAATSFAVPFVGPALPA